VPDRLCLATIFPGGGAKSKHQIGPHCLVSISECCSIKKKPWNTRGAFYIL